MKPKKNSPRLRTRLGASDANCANKSLRTHLDWHNTGTTYLFSFHAQSEKYYYLCSVAYKFAIFQLFLFTPFVKLLEKELNHLMWFVDLISGVPWLFTSSTVAPSVKRCSTAPPTWHHIGAGTNQSRPTQTHFTWTTHAHPFHPLLQPGQELIITTPVRTWNDQNYVFAKG